jgi:hypothetical protein
MFWILASVVVANGAIQVDASQEEKPYFQAKVDRLLTDMGWNTPSGVTSHLKQARELTDQVFKVADNIVAHNPDVVD